MKKTTKKIQMINPPSLPEARVLVAVPSGGSWEADFGMSMLAMVANGAIIPEGYSNLSIGVQNTKGSILPQLRTKLVQKAQEIGATHIFFVDSDMQFPAWTLHRMLEQKKEVLACNCVTKSLPTVPTARFNDGTVSGTPVRHFDYDGTVDCIPVWRVGTGVMLIEMGVFEKIGHPYFPITQVGSEIVGEDWGFCQRCEDAGIEIYVDLVMSPYIGHIGRLEYKASMQDMSANKQVVSTPN